MILVTPRREGPIETLVPQNGSATGGGMGTSGTWGGWAQIVASLTFDYRLCGVYMEMVYSNSGTSENGTIPVQIQIGIGATGVEVPIAQGANEQSTIFTFVTGASIQVGTNRLLRFAPINIPAGTKISLRTVSATTITTLNGHYLVGYNLNNGVPADIQIPNMSKYMRGIGNSLTACYPSATGTSVVSTTTAWVPGTPVEFISSAKTNMLITGVTSSFTAGTTGVHGVIDLGIGPASNEVWVARGGIPCRNLMPSLIGNIEFLRPVFVKKGERVALRLATSGTSARTAEFTIIAQELK